MWPKWKLLSNGNWYIIRRGINHTQISTVGWTEPPHPEMSCYYSWHTERIFNPLCSFSSFPNKEGCKGFLFLDRQPQANREITQIWFSPFFLLDTFLWRRVVGSDAKGRYVGASPTPCLDCNTRDINRRVGGLWEQLPSTHHSFMWVSFTVWSKIKKTIAQTCWF